MAVGRRGQQSVGAMKKLERDRHLLGELKNHRRIKPERKVGKVGKRGI